MSPLAAQILLGFVNAVIAELEARGALQLNAKAKAAQASVTAFVNDGRDPTPEERAAVDAFLAEQRAELNA